MQFPVVDTIGHLALAHWAPHDAAAVRAGRVVLLGAVMFASDASLSASGLWEA